MAKVICKLDNASGLINGVKFTADRGQMISEDIPDEVAAEFVKIPGYTMVRTKEELAADEAAAKKAAEDAKKAGKP